MYQLHVFVGSHMDELRFERETAIEVIRELNLLPGLFELLPAVSESPKRACIELVRDCDLMVLILGCRFSAPTLAEYHEAIARHKPIVIMVRWSNEERDDAVKDLLVDLQGRFVYKEYGTLSQFRNELKQALISEMGRALHPPLYTLTREEMYDLGADIIETSQRRLAVVQRTPSLFFGARPYHMPDEQKWGYEQRLLNSLERWVESALEDPARTLVYAYSPLDSKQHLDQQDDAGKQAILQKCRSSVRKYKEIEEATGLRLCFAPLRTTFSGPLAVGDDRVAFWLLGEYDAVAIYQENRSIADVVIRMLSAHIVKGLDAGAILEELLPQEYRRR